MGLNAFGVAPERQRGAGAEEDKPKQDVADREPVERLAGQRGAGDLTDPVRRCPHADRLQQFRQLAQRHEDSAEEGQEWPAPGP